MSGVDILGEMRLDHANAPVCSRGLTPSCWQAAAVYLVSASHVMLRVALASIVLVSTSAYCWSVASAAKPGLLRLLITLPAVVAIHLVPLLFDQPSILRVSATFVAVRLTSGKLIAFILGRGVLVLPLSLLQFSAVMLAPFMPAQLMTSRLTPSSGCDVGNPTAAAAPAKTTEQPPAPASAPAAIQHNEHLQTFRAAAAHRIWQRVTPTQRYSIDSNIGRQTTVRQRRVAAASTSNSSTCSSSCSSTGNPQDVHLLPNGKHDQSQAPLECTNSACSSSGDSKDSNATASSKSLARANLLLNLLVVAAFFLYTCTSWQRFTSAAISMSCLGFMWKAMEAMMWMCSSPAETYLGMTLAPHFKNPYVSESLTDFWARRWNITQGLVLRFYVYEPIVQGRLVEVTPPAVPGAADPNGVLVRKQSAASGPAPPAQGKVAADSNNNGACNLCCHQKPRSLAALDNLWMAIQHLCSRVAGAAVGAADAPAADASAIQSGSKGTINQSHSLPAAAAATDSPPPPLLGYLEGIAESPAAQPPFEGLAASSTPSLSDKAAGHKDWGPALSSSRCDGSSSSSMKHSDSSSSIERSNSRSNVPVLAGPSAAVANRWRRQLAAAATFIVSGLEHELFLLYATHRVDGRWFVFFALQGLLLAAESSMRRHGQKLGLALHPRIASLAVLLLLGMTADAFFWGPVKAALLQPWMLDPIFWWWDAACLVLPLPPLVEVMDRMSKAGCLGRLWLPEWAARWLPGAVGAVGPSGPQCLAAVR